MTNSLRAEFFSEYEGHDLKAFQPGTYAWACEVSKDGKILHTTLDDRDTENAAFAAGRLWIKKRERKRRDEEFARTRPQDWGQW